jgi:hypothetical protein
MTGSRTLQLGAAVLLALGALAATTPADAVRKRDQENQGGNFPEKGPWRELQVAPPTYPEDGNLVELKLTGRTANRYYVDATSLSVGTDEVVRFVLVIRTPEDSGNVSYSGLRCESRQWKDYAFAGRDRNWRVDERAKWRPIQARSRNNVQETLFKDYFCYGGVMTGGPAGDAQGLVRNLKHPLVQDNRVPRRYNE